MSSLIGAVISAWIDVRSKPGRTLAAIAGMVAAVIAVVIVDAAAILSQDANDDYIARTYGRTATLSIAPSSIDGMSPEERAAAAHELTVRLNANGVTNVSTSVDVALVVVLDGGATRTNGRWVSSNYPDVTILDIVAGAFPQETARSDVLHAVISLDLARQLGFSGADALGQILGYALTENAGIDLRTTLLQPLVIDAVAESSALSFGSAGILLVSDLDRTDLLGEFFSRSWLVHVHPADISLVGSLTDSVLKHDSQQPVYMLNRLDQGENLAPVLEQQRTTARAVTVVALVVGGLGIFGIGLATVRERGKDYGLRRALGASKRIIFVAVILQTLIEVLLAAALAIPLSAIVIELFARQLVLETLPLPASTALPFESAARGLVAALVVGLLAGLFPAIRAARVSVVQAIRD